MAKKILLREVMQTRVVTCSKDDSVCETANRMKHHKIGVVLVVDKSKRIQGIITERDILNKVSCFGKDSREVFVKDVMTKKVIVGKPNMSDIQAAGIFSRHAIKKLPIVEKGRLAGIVTQTDLLKLLTFKWAL